MITTDAAMNKSWRPELSDKSHRRCFPSYTEAKMLSSPRVTNIRNNIKVTQSSLPDISSSLFNRIFRLTRTVLHKAFWFAQANTFQSSGLQWTPPHVLPGLHPRRTPIWQSWDG